MPQFCFRLSFLIVLLAGSSLHVVACDSADCTCQNVVHSRQNGCWIATTENFKVCSFRSANQAERVAQHCERLRATLAETHGLKGDATHWSPKCEVFLFVDKHKYGTVVGRQAVQSLGSSLVKPQIGTIKSRRIDLRTDVPNYLEEVLPHELSHVLIADHFRAGLPPLWYDEGLALLADSPTKQTLHQRDLRRGISHGMAFSLSSLLTAKSYPAADKVGVFYGQCASLTRCLCQVGPPEIIHYFARRSEQVGVNLALQEAYGINGVNALESVWRKSLNAQVAGTPAVYSLIKSSD